MLSRRQFVYALGAGGVALSGCRPDPSALIPEGESLQSMGLDEFVDYDAVGLAQLINRGDVTQQEILAVFQKRIERLNPSVNCIATPTFDRANQLAGTISRDAVFSGVPTLIKDMIDVGGVRRTDGSRLMESNVPKDSVAYIKALEASGLNILGMTTTPEFAGGLESELFGKTHNPWNLDYTCALSSSGSAAAVASGMVPLAHGTDGGGSIRLPSSACHIFGLKPSRYRMLSGEVAGDHDLFKTNGPMSRTVRDAATLFAHTEDRTNEHYDPVGLVLGASKKRLKIAYVREGVVGYSVDPAIQAVQDDMALLLQGLGHQVDEVIHPVDGREYYERFIYGYMPKWLPVLDVVRSVSGKSAHESGLLSNFVTTMIESAKDYTPEQVQLGQDYLARVSSLYDTVFTDYDIILSAVSPVEAPRQNQLLPSDNWADKSDILREILALTAPVNGAGDCAMSVPAGFSGVTGMPVGSMFNAKAGNEKMLFELAYELEQAQPWKDDWAPYSAKNIA
jgi:amidase